MPWHFWALAACAGGEGTGLQEIRYAALEGRECAHALPDLTLEARGTEPSWAVRVSGDEALWITPEELEVAPSTDLILLDVYPHRDHVHVGSLLEVTDREGYDNQPHFRDEDRILFSSIREGDQSDIYQFTISEESVERLTDTPESEFSPRLVPTGDGFSVVRVEADGVSQRLYVYPFEEGDPIPLLEGVDDVGYHAWAGAGRVALFRVGEPSSLHLADLETGEARHIQDHVGTSLQSIPGEEAVSFVDTSGDAQWQLKRLDGRTGEVTNLAEAPPDGQEHVWLSNVTVVMAHEGVLYRTAPGRDPYWTPFLNLGPYLGSFTRFAMSPSGLRLTVVVTREEGGD